MRNDRVLIPVLRVAHDAKCFRLVYTRIYVDNYPTTLLYPKMPTFGLYECKVEGSGWGSIENGASLRLIQNLSFTLTCFDRAESLHHNLSVILLFLHSYDEKNRQKLSITYVIKCPV